MELLHTSDVQHVLLLKKSDPPLWGSGAGSRPAREGGREVGPTPLGLWGGSRPARVGGREGPARVPPPIPHREVVFERSPEAVVPALCGPSHPTPPQAGAAPAWACTQMQSRSCLHPNGYQKPKLHFRSVCQPA